MADQTARIEALLATLSDDSSVAVENALRIYEPSEVIAVLAKMVLDGGGGGGGSSPVLTQAFSWTAQEIKDSTLTPPAIIPAQGANTLIVPTMYVLDFAKNTTPFPGGGALEYVHGSLNLNSINDILFGNNADYVGFVHHALSSGWAEGGDPADYLNQPVRLRASLRGAIAGTSPSFTTGDFYMVGDTGSVDDGSTLAAYIVTAVAAPGVPSPIVSFTITSGGDGYTLGAGGIATDWTTTPGGSQPGTGSGFVVSVSEVDGSASAGDGTLSGVIYYVVADFT